MFSPRFCCFSCDLGLESTINKKMVGFFDAIARAFKNSSFYGRSTRAEYWWFQLFGNIVSGLLIAAAIYFKHTALFVIFYVFLFIFILPNFPLTIRRMHDSETSGWNILWGLIPCFGPIILLVIMTMPSDKYDNIYGPCPVEVRLVMSYPLVDFANEHGKMQVAWDYNKKSRLYDMSFTFTNQSGEVIRVYPSEELKYLEPEQLPNYKSWLYVNEYSNGHYMLFLNMPQETNDQGITLTSQGVTSA